MLRYFSLLLMGLFLSGCSVKHTEPGSSKIHELSHTLHSLDREIPVQEVKMLAKDIYRKSGKLAHDFELVSPPQYHNFLVNVGLRKRGLCYHFSDALYLHLRSQNYEHFDFHLVGANIGEYWSEHNALLVVPKGCISEGCIWENGVVIDAWRNSGELFYVKMKGDESYRWHHRSARCEPRK